MSTDDGGPRTPFLRRVFLVFTAPGTLGDHLKERPVWWDVAFLGIALVVAANWLIPPEVWQEFMRTQALAAGQDPGATSDLPVTAVRVGTLVGAPLAWLVFLFLSSGVMAFVFAFLLGDSGRYGQYLSATAHASVIGALGALLVTPLKIAQRDPQLTLSVGTFFQGVMGDGFLLAFLRGLDLFGLWAWVAMAVIYSRFDEERSAGSAVALVMGVFLAFILVVAYFQTRALG